MTGWNTAGQSIEVAGHAEAVHRGEVIVLAVPFTSIDALLAKSNSISMSDHFRARSIEHMTTLAIAINRRHKTHDARFRVVGLIRAPA